MTRATLAARWQRHQRWTSANRPPLNAEGKPDWQHPDPSRCSNDWWRLGVCDICHAEGGCAAMLKNESMKPTKKKRIGRPPLKPGHQRVAVCVVIKPQVLRAARRQARRNVMSLSRTVETLLQNWIESGMP